MDVSHYNALNQATMLANAVSPTSEVQAAFVRMRVQMYLAGHTNEEVLSHIVGCIKDGIDHGNWPTND